MKKTLIALAVAATSFGAFAQSSVTLYGRLDASVGQTKDTVTNVKLTRLANGSDAGLTGSRFGFQGTEDLGGGLKAVFRLENRLNVDDGNSTSSTFFNGESRVGLAGGFGELHLGRTYPAIHAVEVLALARSVYDSAFTPAFGIASSETRTPNGLFYNSPKFSGFSVHASVGFKETTTVGAKNPSSFAAMYGAGPLSAGIGFHKNAGGDDIVALSGAYDLGVAALSGGYVSVDGVGTTNDQAGVNLGVEVPFGAFSVSAGLSSGKTETKAGATVSKETGFGLGGTYTLSKRTRLYAGLNDKKIENAAGRKTAGTRFYAAGVRHDF